MEYRLVYVTVLLALCGGEVLGYPGRAPKRACVPLVPLHGNMLAQTTKSPYRLMVTATEYTPEAKIAGYFYYYSYKYL